MLFTSSIFTTSVPVDSHVSLLDIINCFMDLLRLPPLFKEFGIINKLVPYLSG